MSGDRLVWSSDSGGICPQCKLTPASCRCRRTKGADKRIRPSPSARGARPKPADGVVRVGRSTQGRKGKVVTTIDGVPLRGEALGALVAQLKSQCGAGGAVKDGSIEIQGEHRDRLVALLAAHGWTVKRVG